MSKWTFIFLIFFLWHQEKNMLILYSKYGLKMNQFQELHFLITAKNLQLTLSIQSSSCGFKVELPRQLWLTLHSSAGVCTDGWLRFLQLITMTNESCDMHFFPSLFKISYLKHKHLLLSVPELFSTIDNDQTPVVWKIQIFDTARNEKWFHSCLEFSSTVFLNYFHIGRLNPLKVMQRLGTGVDVFIGHRLS